MLRSPVNPYAYVSFSPLTFNYEIEDLIAAGRSWRSMRGRTLASFSSREFRDDLWRRMDGVEQHKAQGAPSGMLAERVLDVLLEEDHRRGPAEFILAQKEKFVAPIAAAISAGQPVEIVLPAFPGRQSNPITRLAIPPNLAEIASFAHLWSIAERVRAVYSPGLLFTIISDGIAYAPFYGNNPVSHEQYKYALTDLIAEMDAGNSIRIVDLQDLVDERRQEYDAIYPEVEREIEQQWSDTAYEFRDELIETMKMGTNTACINAAAVQLVKFVDESERDRALLSDMREAVYACARRTAFIYQCFLVTIRRMELIDRRFPGAIRGTVHPKPGQYSPHLVNRFSTTSPWHGTALVRADGRVDTAYEAEVFLHAGKYQAVFLRGNPIPFCYEEV